MRPLSMFEPTELPPASLRKNQSSDDLVRDAQVRNQNEIMEKQLMARLVLFAGN